MPLYKWQCTECDYIDRAILATRPIGRLCTKCQGAIKFLTFSTSSTKEVIDNGLMYKPLERAPDIEAQIKERNELAEKDEDKLV